MIDLNIKNYKILGRMDNKVASKIRELDVYDVSYIMDIPDSCAIRYTMKVFLLFLVN